MSKVYKYIDSTNQSVHIFDEDGVSRSSALVEALPEGVSILPADIPPTPQQVDPVEKLRQFLAANPDVAAYIQQ